MSSNNNVLVGREHLAAAVRSSAPEPEKFDDLDLSSFTRPARAAAPDPGGKLCRVCEHAGTIAYVLRALKARGMAPGQKFGTRLIAAILKDSGKAVGDLANPSVVGLILGGNGLALRYKKHHNFPKVWYFPDEINHMDGDTVLSEARYLPSNAAFKVPVASPQTALPPWDEYEAAKNGGGENLGN